MTKTSIIVLSTIAILFAAVIGLILFSYYGFTHASFLNPEQMNDVQIALKGSLGQALFSVQRPEPISDEQLKGKTGLDALLAPVPGANRGQGLIKEYQENPQRFKQYADMFDTAMTAKQVGQTLLDQPIRPLPRTSDSLPIAFTPRVDAWGRAFCIIPVGERLAVVSGGPTHLSCDSLPLTAADIAKSQRAMYSGPSNIIVVVLAKPVASQPVVPNKSRPGAS